MLLASIHSKIITLTVENYKKLMFLTAEAVLVIAVTNPLTPPPPSPFPYKTYLNLFHYF